MVYIDIDKVADGWREEADEIGITPTRMQKLDTGKSKAIRFDTIDELCKRYRCQPGDLFVYVED